MWASVLLYVGVCVCLSLCESMHVSLQAYICNFVFLYMCVSACVCACVLTCVSLCSSMTDTLCRALRIVLPWREGCATLSGFWVKPNRTQETRAQATVAPRGNSLQFNTKSISQSEKSNIGVFQESF